MSTTREVVISNLFTDPTGQHTCSIHGQLVINSNATFLNHHLQQAKKSSVQSCSNHSTNHSQLIACESQINAQNSYRFMLSSLPSSSN